MNVSTSSEENTKVSSSSTQASGEVTDRAQIALLDSDNQPCENDTKKGNEETAADKTEKAVAEIPESASSLVKNETEKSTPDAPTTETELNIGNETKASGSGSSDPEDKVETNEEKQETTTANVDSPAIIADDNAERNSKTEVKTDSKNEDESQGKPAVVEAPKKRTRKKWKKPVGKPNRPLSAYNLYFQKERAIMLGDAAEKIEQEPGKKRVHRKTHGKIGFAEMAKIIGAKWKKLPEDEKEEFVKVAAQKKEEYAKDLEKWREEQKKKAIINAMGPGPKSKMGKFSADNDDLVQQIAEDREKLLRQHQAFRMQMMQEMQVGYLGPFPGEGHGRQMPTIEYLRNMQDDRTGQFFGRHRNGAPSSLFSHYPSAAEGSGRDLYQQMVAMTSGPEGQGGEPDQYRQLKMTRGTMGPMGGAMGGNPMNGHMGNNGMGMVPISNRGSQIPSSAPYHQYEMDRYQHMRHENQMHGMSQGQPGIPSHEGPSYNNMEASMRRFQQHSHYN